MPRRAVFCPANSHCKAAEHHRKSIAGRRPAESKHVQVRVYQMSCEYDLSPLGQWLLVSGTPLRRPAQPFTRTTVEMQSYNIIPIIHNPYMPRPFSISNVCTWLARACSERSLFGRLCCPTVTLYPPSLSCRHYMAWTETSVAMHSHLHCAGLTAVLQCDVTSAVTHPFSFNLYFAG